MKGSGHHKGVARGNSRLLVLQEKKNSFPHFAYIDVFHFAAFLIGDG